MAGGMVLPDRQSFHCALPASSFSPVILPSSPVPSVSLSHLSLLSRNESRDGHLVGECPRGMREWETH
jgi:hypothetical protein